MFGDDDGRTYKAVVNDEGHYSIWPAERPNPADAGARAPVVACLQTWNPTS
jgi:uncharacterized protein YbdZ (MbtH family)